MKEKSIVHWSPQKRETGIAYILWLFTGFMGGHKFYLEKIGMGILYMFTGGILGLGWFIDLFTLPGQVRRFNEKREGYFSPERTIPPQTATGKKDRSFYMENRPMNARDVEKTILLIAQRKKGLVTPMDIAVESPISIDDAKKELDKLVQKGYADMEVTSNGMVVYRLFSQDSI